MTKVLFVCTGNTCRSPMAACLFNELCGREGYEFTAESAGLHAPDGALASDGARAAMEERGLSLGDHRARTVNPQMMKDAVVIAMSPNHARECRQRFAQADIRVFDPPISDPYGGTAAQYRQTALEIEKQLSDMAKRILGKG